jgi:hypothetical protein
MHETKSHSGISYLCHVCVQKFQVFLVRDVQPILRILTQSIVQRNSYSYSFNMNFRGNKKWKLPLEEFEELIAQKYKN